MNPELRVVGTHRDEIDLWSRYSLMSPEPVVIGIGLVSLDVVYGMDRLCGPRLSAGGTCGNVLTGLSLLGWRAYPVTRRPNDEAGRRLRDDLLHWNVRLDFLDIEPASRTPIIVQTIRTDSTGKIEHRFSVTCPSCSRRLPHYSPVTRRALRSILADLPVPQVMFIDRLSSGAVTLAEHMRLRGALVWFEPSGVSNKHLLSRMLAVTDVLKYSRESSGRLPGLRRRKATVPLEVETLGSRGLRYRGTMFSARERGWHEVATPALSELRDASGAGDWCSVGILHALGQAGADGILGAPRDIIEDGLSLGQALGAWTCAFEGARGGMYLMDLPAIGAHAETLLSRGSSAAIPVATSCAPVADVFGELCSACELADIKPGGSRRKTRRGGNAVSRVSSE